MVLGFRMSHLKTGLQYFVGELALLCIVSPPVVWKALSLDSPSTSPVLAAVVYSLVMQHTLGRTIQFYTYYTCAAIVGGVLGIACMYLTYLCNGLSYEPSVTKAAVMTLLVTLISFSVALLRFKHTWAGFPGAITCKSLVIVALSGFHLDVVEPRVLLYWWIQVAVAVPVAALASFLVFPVTVAGRLQSKTAYSLRRLGQLTAETVELMLSLELRADGRPAAATGNVQGPKAVDSGLEPMLEGLEAIISSVLGNIESLRKLLAVVALEWKVLRQIRKWRGRPQFPSKTYELLLLDIRSFLTAVQMLVLPLQSGKMSLRDVQRAEGELRPIVACLQQCMVQAADCLENKQPYSEALSSLGQLEKLVRNMGDLSAARGGGEPSPDDDNAALTADTVVAGLFLLATRVRQIFFVVPEAVYALQPDAREQWRQHFDQGSSWDLRERQGQMRARALKQAPPAAVEVTASPFGAPSQQFPRAIHLPPEEESLRERVILRLERLFRSKREHLTVAFQLAVAVTIACVLHVDADTYAALHKRTIWIVITVIVVQESQLGGVLIKSILRIAGTGVGGGIGLGLMGLTSLASGGYAQGVPKFATMCCLMPLFTSAFFVFRSRWPAPYGYFFTVVLFTTPIVGLAGYQDGSTQWVIAWYRILMVLIGIGLLGAVAILLFPRTSLGSARHRIQAALTGLSDLADTVLGSFAEPSSGFFSQRMSLAKVDEALAALHEPAPAPGAAVQVGRPAGSAPAPQDCVTIEVVANDLDEMFYDQYTHGKSKDSGMRRQRRAWLRQHVLGPAFSALYAQSGPVASKIYNIGYLRYTAMFDYNPFNTPHVVPAKAIMAAQLACRRALNSLMSLVYLFDSSDVPHVALLLPHAEEMEQVVEQVTACLLGMSRMAEGRCSLETTMPMVNNLCAQVAQLVVAVEASPERQTADEADVVVGLAALGVLQTTCTSIQLIQAAVVGLFGTAADKERAETEGLQGGAGAAMDALLLVHLGTSKGSAIPEGLQLAVRAASRDL